MDIQQRLVQQQRLILSPQLRQYLKLLQLPILELRQALEQEMVENPMLEEVPLSAQNEVSLSALDGSLQGSGGPSENQELDFQTQIDQLSRLDQEFKEEFYNGAEPSEDEIKDREKKKIYQESIVTKPPTLSDYVLWQLGFLNLDENEKELARELIGNVDEDGYLRANLEEIAQKFSVDLPTVEKVLNALQDLDPPGVCARNLQETLLIQLRKKGDETVLAQKIVAEQLPLLEKKHFLEIAKRLGVAEEEVRQAYQTVTQLEPKPGGVFHAQEPVSVVPDATVSRQDEGDEEHKIEIHDEPVPRLRINPMYRRMLQQKNLDPETRKFLKEKLNAALWLIRAISQRKSTIRAITEEIVKAQKEFFDQGFSHLKPLRLKDIAEKVGIHESTVSRALASKYICTPQGTIPYKSFFSNKLETQDGSLESQKSIMEKIRRLIEEEDKKHPLSDSKIASLLNTNGVKIARRTIAKYREMMKILPTHLRKQR